LMETSFWSVSGRDHLDPAACINKPTVPPGGFLSTKITYAFKHNTDSPQVNPLLSIMSQNFPPRISAMLCYRKHTLTG
ncbi:MAG: hypothetical protein L6300_07930, partial [Syntrophaceae bacterium]|nr:hypothetical protein [Pseudomonadota bacterium]MCG2740155.1 hypothetical protein [Syntrophaceae bacterium]